MAVKSKRKTGDRTDSPRAVPLAPATANQLDQKLSALFSSTYAPVQELAAKEALGSSTEQISASASPIPEGIVFQEVDGDGAINEPATLETSSGGDGSVEPPSRKRKQRVDMDDIEARYMARLARDNPIETIGRNKKQRLNESSDVDQSETAQNTNESIPQHETLTPRDDDAELQKATRTVFLGNVSTDAIKSKPSQRELRSHLVSFVKEQPKDGPEHKIESLRFRSTAFSSSKVPKKGAFARKELMNATMQCTNAYAVYSTVWAAREAVKHLNGSIILDRHLRVDSVAHPAPVNHKRCVFVGNLGFVDDDSLIKAAETPEDDEQKKKKRSKPPGDVEEGLWKQFGTAGEVESVRVIRDSSTRVGKGIAYVQFKDANAVERALSFNDKRYPPLLTRKLRVTRAKKPSKTTLRAEKNLKQKKADSKDRKTREDSSQKGRAQKLLGKGGAAQGKRQKQGSREQIDDLEIPVFEGHRAKAGRDKISFKPSKSQRKKDRTTAVPKRTKRSAAFRSGRVAKRFA